MVLLCSRYSRTKTELDSRSRNVVKSIDEMCQIIPKDRHTDWQVSVMEPVNPTEVQVASLAANERREEAREWRCVGKLLLISEDEYQFIDGEK